MISRLEFRSKFYHHDLNNHTFVLCDAHHLSFSFYESINLKSEASQSSQLTFGVKKRKMHYIIDQGKSSSVFSYE